MQDESIMMFTDLFVPHELAILQNSAHSQQNSRLLTRVNIVVRVAARHALEVVDRCKMPIRFLNVDRFKGLPGEVRA